MNGSLVERLAAALPVAPILLPLGAAFLLALLHGSAPRAVGPILVATALSLGAAAATVAGRVFTAGPWLYRLGGWAPPLGIELVVDELAAVFLLLVAGAMAVALLHAAAGGRPPGRRGILLCLLAAGAAGWTLTGDLFNLFVFVEITSIAAIGLAADRRDGPAAAHAFLYLLFASLSATLFLLAVALLYGTLGTLNLAQLAAAAPTLPPRTAGLALALVVVSFGIKVGMVPLHIWKPGVYASAGPAASSVFSGAVLSCAFYGLARLASVLTAGGEPHVRTLSALLLLAGMANILVGHGMALIQRDLNRLLAFSSVAHAGYVLLGFGLGTTAGFAAGLLHAGNHVVMKMAAFLAVPLLLAPDAPAPIARLRGAARRTPFALALFMIAALALVGVPPTHGFTGKWALARAALAQGRLLPVLVIAAGTVISLTYYARIMTLALRPSVHAGPPPPRRPALALTTLLALACLLLGFAAAPAWPALEAAARRLVDPVSLARLVFPGPP